MRPLAMHPTTPPCPDCGAETEQIHLPKAVQWRPDPVIIYRAKDGSYRFPGDAGGLSAHNYNKQGFERVEIRGATEMRRFESHMNKHEYARAQRAVEMKQRGREERERVSRGELRRVMPQMSERGRSLAREVMRRNDNKPKDRASSAEFHNQAYSFDRSNREESRDTDGRRRRD